MDADTQTPTLPTAAAFAAVRAATQAALIGTDAHLWPTVNRGLEIAEAGLRLRDAWGAEHAETRHKPCKWCPACAAVAEFDAAVRAACGEGV